VAPLDLLRCLQPTVGSQIAIFRPDKLIARRRFW
jgi:hypothetical protein